MRVEKGKVRAPEIGRLRLNSSRLSFRQLRGRAVLVDFRDYTCVNCIRTLPYKSLTPQKKSGEGSYVVVQHARMYSLVDNHDFGGHVLELSCPAGVAAFAFTFTSCVDPSGAPASAVVESRR